MKFIKNIVNIRDQAGQTLVETMVGIFVLTIGISTALGLAISLYSSSNGAVKQVVGTGLAREGVEALFNMRATNWLKGQLSATGCYNFVTATNNDAPCHTDWQNVSGAYDIRSNPGSKSYVLDINPGLAGSTGYWLFDPENNGFALNYDSTATIGRFYYPAKSTSGTSEYYRKINIAEENPTYTNDPAFRRLKITSQVWWSDKGCPQSTTWPTSGKCRVELISYMTNWRNY